MNNEEIISICQQLSEEGKEPTVALIKARLSKPAPMPFVIGGLKQWRANPNVKLENRSEVNDSSTPTQTIEQRVSALEEEVKDLKMVIAKLLAASER